VTAGVDDQSTKTIVDQQPPTASTIGFLDDIRSLLGSTSSLLAAGAALIVALTNAAVWSSGRFLLCATVTALVIYAVCSYLYFRTIVGPDSTGSVKHSSAYSNTIRRAALLILVGLPIGVVISIAVYVGWLSSPFHLFVESTLPLSLAGGSVILALAGFALLRIKDQRYALLLRFAKLLLVMVPILLMVCLASYAGGYFVPPHRLVITMTEFSDNGTNVPCDISALLANELDSSVQTLGESIQVQHFQYAIPGFGTQADDLASMFGHLTNSDIVIFGGYYPGKDGAVYIVPRFSIVNQFGHLERAKNLVAINPSPIQGKPSDLCGEALDTTNHTLTKYFSGFATMLVGLLDFQAHKYQSARRALLVAYSHNIGYQDVVAYYLGETFFELGDDVSAEKYLKDAAVTEDPRAFIDLGLVYDDLGDYEHALLEYDNAIKVGGDTQILARYDRGLLERNHLNDFDGGDADIRWAANYMGPADRDDAGEYQHRCMARLNMNEVADAEADCRQAIAEDPSVSQYYDTLGDVYIKVGQYGRASVLYDTASSIDAHDLYALYSRGFALLSDKDRSAAHESFYRLAHSEATSASDLTLQGDGFRELLDPHSAILRYTDALKQNNRFRPAWYHRALERLQQHDYRDAENDLRVLIAMDAGDADAFRNLGDALAHESERGAATRYYLAAAGLYCNRNDKASFSQVVSAISKPPTCSRWATPH
jgi:tetratricopeptide (TPR) repeat protein